MIKKTLKTNQLCIVRGGKNAVLMQEEQIRYIPFHRPILIDIQSVFCPFCNAEIDATPDSYTIKRFKQEKINYLLDKLVYLACIHPNLGEQQI